jgi:hypothetical protein
MMGSLPTIFDSTCSYAKGFIEGVQKYIHLNEDILGFHLPMKKITLALTLMQGHKVEGWIADIGSALDLLDLAQDNIPALWDQFLLEFAEQYQDTQAAERARAELKNLRLKVPEIDQYIAKFKDLCCKVGYTQGNAEVTHLFHKGLPRLILEETIKGPQDYVSTKQCAIQATRNQQLIQNILGQCAPSNFTPCFQGNNNRPSFIN